MSEQSCLTNLDPHHCADFFSIGQSIRCPPCRGQSVLDSDSDIAIQIRQDLAVQLQSGASKAEIFSYVQAQYGQEVVDVSPDGAVFFTVLLTLVFMLSMLRRATR